MKQQHTSKANFVRWCHRCWFKWNRRDIQLVSSLVTEVHLQIASEALHHNTAPNTASNLTAFLLSCGLGSVRSPLNIFTWHRIVPTEVKSEFQCFVFQYRGCSSDVPLKRTETHKTQKTSCFRFRVSSPLLQYTLTEQYLLHNKRMSLERFSSPAM